MTKETIKRWASKVMGQLNLSEEGKLINFGDYAVSLYEKGIKEREKIIKSLKEERDELIERAEEILSEYNEDIEVTALNVDVTAISTRNDREKYFNSYDSSLSHALAQYDAQVEHIDSIKTQYNTSIEQIEKEIEILNRKMSVITKE